MKMRGALVALIAASTLAGCALNPVAKPTPASPQVEGYTFAAGMVDAGAGAQTYTKFNGTIGISTPTRSESVNESAPACSIKRLWVASAT